MTVWSTYLHCYGTFSVPHKSMDLLLCLTYGFKVNLLSFKARYIFYTLFYFIPQRHFQIDLDAVYLFQCNFLPFQLHSPSDTTYTKCDLFINWYTFQHSNSLKWISHLNFGKIATDIIKCVVEKTCFTFIQKNWS